MTTLNQRFGAVKDYMACRNIRNYMSAFAAVGMDLSFHAKTIKSYWRTGKMVKPEHGILIESMEAAVDRMKLANEKKA